MLNILILKIWSQDEKTICTGEPLMRVLQVHVQALEVSAKARVGEYRKKDSKL